MLLVCGSVVGGGRELVLSSEWLCLTLLKSATHCCYALRSVTRRWKGLGGGLLGLAEGDGEEVLADGAACLLGIGLE